LNQNFQNHRSLNYICMFDLLHLTFLSSLLHVLSTSNNLFSDHVNKDVNKLASTPHMEWPTSYMDWLTQQNGPTLWIDRRPTWEADVYGRTRVRHGYRKTHGFSKTGSAGTGTVVDFGIPRHTATRTRGIAGTYGYYYHKVSIIFAVLKVVFSNIFSDKFIVSHCDATKHGCQPRVHLCFSPSTRFPLTPTPIPLQKTM
jgi:hypothetical protein